jgi:serine/threonine-protein kinase
MVGRTVLHYQLLEKLGAGGMGEIFKAQDTRLNRYVAVKVLSSTGGGGDVERRKRFTQEAQAASALNHPNIITIHDIISDGDTDYMVMEYVSGKTLVDLIPKGGLRAPQVLKYTVQMADALNAAHTAGIIHRDLKPGNVMVTDSGLVKVLDFGLAKLTDRGPLSQMGEDTDDKTRTIANAPLTVEGSIIGTVSYMSPEQAQGKKVDTRSDIFSFGVVMYEMATGVRAFPGDSALSTLSAILRDEVKPLVEAAPEAPPQLDLVIQRCLRKNPDERWQTMKDVQMALAALKHESDSGMLYRARMADIPSRAPATVVTKPVNAPATLPPPDVAHIQVKSPDEKKSSPGLMIGAVAAAVVLLGAGGAAWWYKHRPVPPPPAPVVETPAPAPPVAVVTPPPAEPAPPPENILTNDSVIEMVKSKVPDSVVLSQIRSEKTNFTLTTPEIIRLSNAGVPAIIIEGMRDPKKIPEQPVVSKPPVVTPTTPPKQVATAPKQTPAVVPTSTPPPPVPQPVATPTPAPAPPVVTPVAAPPVHPATASVVVPDATPFPVLLSADIMKGMDAGTPLRFTAEQDFKIGDNVVIAKGTVVTGSIVDTGGNRILGMGAKMSLRIDQTESTAAQKIALRALGARKPDGVTTRPAEVKGNSSKGKDVVATAGSEYYAYIDGEQKVTVKK